MVRHQFEPIAEPADGVGTDLLDIGRGHERPDQMFLRFLDVAVQGPSCFHLIEQPRLPFADDLLDVHAADLVLDHPPGPQRRSSFQFDGQLRRQLHKCGHHPLGLLLPTEEFCDIAERRFAAQHLDRHSAFVADDDAALHRGGVAGAGHDLSENMREG